MADISLSGPSYSTLSIDSANYLSIFAKATPAAGGGTEYGLNVYSISSAGFEFSSESWLGARGSSYITRIGQDDFAHSTLRISEDDKGTYLTIGIRLEQVGLVRFNNNGQVTFGNYQSEQQHLVLPYEGINFDWPRAKKIDAKLSYNESALHEVNGNRIYFFAVSNHNNEAFKAHCYLEIERGYPVFRFSSHSVFVCDEQLIVVFHRNEKSDERSLSSKAYGYCCIPANAKRSIAVYDHMGNAVGTAQVSEVKDQQIVSFTNGDLSWQE